MQDEAGTDQFYFLKQSNTLRLSLCMLSSPYLLGCPLEASQHAVLDLIKVLHTLGNIHQQVRAGSVRSEAPDLPGLTNIPLVLVGEVAGTGLELLARGDFTLLDVLGQAIFEGTGLHEQTVVLVGRL